MERVTERYRECMEGLLQELEREFMEILANREWDKGEKNRRTKPLVTKKQILLNTLEALQLVDREGKDPTSS
ncbi:MAG: hypothetical protein GXO19_00760 [Epsilonproteobacteria bacterium]|nr:hypothetical protein [Campylobacterota bacterium]NPA56244.1 hypothetical protein [Campylobacterota bacterium]